MSAVIDLSLYGCPMHYIKAREALRQMEIDQAIVFWVNNGDAVKEVMTSLRQDGQLCEIVSEEKLTSSIRVVKKV